MRFTTLALVACAAFNAAMADVSHLAKQYIPPNTMMPPNGAKMVSLNNASPIKHMGERTVTTIEKQELRELPTQTEYLLPGQMPYGIGAISSKSNYNQNGLPVRGHSNERPLEMMMPRELLSPPPIPKQEQQPIAMPTNQYLAPMGNKESTTQTNQDSMPSKHYLAPTMNSSEQHQQMSSKTTHSNKKLEQQQPTVLSMQFLAPMSMNEQDHVSQGTSAATPTNEYLAPPTMVGSEEQLQQQQSAPAALYVPPQQQTPEMPSSQHLHSHAQSHEMQMQPDQGSETSQATRHLPPSSEMPQPLMNVVSQMPPSPEYLSPFGEGENVAEAVQEATEMFDEQSVHQPMPPASIDEPTNYYLHPQSSEAQLPQQLNYHDYSEQQPEQLAPVDFVRQHQQLMTQFESVNDTPVSFAQFQSISTAAPIMQVAAEPMPAHFLDDDGYHYRNGGNSNRNTDVRRFRARQ